MMGWAALGTDQFLVAFFYFRNQDAMPEYLGKISNSLKIPIFFNYMKPNYLAGEKKKYMSTVHTHDTTSIKIY